MATNCKTIISAISILLMAYASTAQADEKDYPVVGNQLPAFSLSNVAYYSSTTFKPEDVKGKWLVLDFWSKGCATCVKSFPKLNELQNEFKDHVQFLLIGQNDKKHNLNIKDVYERFRKTQKLNLAIAYDSVLFNRFKIRGVPHVVVVDPNNIVYAIPSSGELTRKNIQALIDNKQPDFKSLTQNSTSAPAPLWSYSLADSINENGLLFRSVLSVNHGEPSMGDWRIDQQVSNGWYHEERITVGQLYCVAYFGEGNWGRQGIYFTNWKYPLLEVGDTSLFNFSYSDNKGFYNYSLRIPPESATKEKLMQVMQRDLKTYFGYDVTEEVRQMPCWILTSTDAAKKLKSKSQRYEGDIGPSGIVAKRITPNSILEFVEHYSSTETIPFIDETNLGYIDISFNAAMTDIADVQGALHKQGLILKKEKREFKVLVLRDPPSQHTSN